MPKLRKPLFSEAASGKMDEETMLAEWYEMMYRNRYSSTRISFDNVNFYDFCNSGK